MSDPRYGQLARLLVTHSTGLKPGENVLIEATHIPEPALTALVEAAIEVGANPVIETKSSRIVRSMVRSGTPEQARQRIKLWGDLELHRMKQMQAYIALRGSENITEMSDVAPEMMSVYEELLLKPVHIDQRVKNTRWCVLRWPNASMAQQAGMSTEAFEDFYFRVCLVDYAAMARAAVPLKELMDTTDRVRIVSPDTDLRFSIKGIGSVPCTGEMNVPDGECFTAPVKDSVEGHIHYNSGTLYRGTMFDDIRLTFKAGQVVDFNSSNNEALGSILDSDPGARYVGEFAIGFNPFIQNPMRDILFDEKIRGSLHLALGQCYEVAENGNRSKVHWDMVLRQESGGEIYFDEVLIRKDGRFVLPQLLALNPENLGTTT
jgi:aminopeptidase